MQRNICRPKRRVEKKLSGLSSSVMIGRSGGTGEEGPGGGSWRENLVKHNKQTQQVTTVDRGFANGVLQPHRGAPEMETSPEEPPCITKGLRRR